MINGGKKMKNPGKDFEKDFQDSAIKAMEIERFKDAPKIFNPHCFKCEHHEARFTPTNICDFTAYSYPHKFYLELKSHLKKSIPFDAIVKNPKDTRLFEMVLKDREHKGVHSFVIFNWRDCDNDTRIVYAELVNDYINTSERKSIPYDWVVENGVKIHHKLKRVRYSYDIKRWLDEFETLINNLK
jgi:recombination protein U